MAFFDTVVIENKVDPTPEVDIMDLVENTEIRELEETTSLLEDAYLLMAENEENWNSIMQACAYTELNHFKENGTEYMFTEATGNGFLASAQAFFAKVWEKIQSLFKKFAVMLSALGKKDKAFVTDNKAAIEAGMKNIPSDAKFKGYQYSSQALGSWSTTINSEKAKAIKCLEDAKTAGAKSEANSDYDKSDVAGKIRGEVAGGSEKLSSSEFNKAMFKKFRGGDDRTEISFTADLVRTAMTALTGQAEVQKIANEAYKDLKKYFADIDKALRTAGKNLSKTKGDEGAAEGINNGLVAIKRGIEVNKATASIFQIGNSIFLTCLKGYSIQCKAICVATVMFREPKKEKVQEGADLTDNGADFLSGVILK